MTPNSLAAALRRLPAAGKKNSAFERRLTGPWRKDEVWYSSQKEHWLGWLSEYDGPGAYDRKTTSGRSAEYIYNHIVCAPMLVWLAEALKIDSNQLNAAIKAALSARPTMMSQSAAVRRVIPWSDIEAKLKP
jgi:hypothetical protein